MTKALHNAAQTRTRATTATPQTQVIPGKEATMASNSAGGVSFKVNDFTRLDRFLILGSEGGSYYASEKALTADNAKAVMRAIKADGVRVVNRIVEISEAGRAPKNDYALFALALVMTHGDAVAQKAAYDALVKVARIGTHVLHLADYVNGMRGWGRGIRKAFARWYNDKTPMQLAQQLVKYANRDGWKHADVLRLAHIKPISATHDALFSDSVGKAKDTEIDEAVAAYMSAVDELKAATEVSKAVSLITEFKLPREVIPTAMMGEKGVWAALVPHMGLEALVRNLATMTRAGYIAPMAAGTAAVVAKMRDAEAVTKSRIHPIKVLAALLTYKSGVSTRGNNTWVPVAQIVDALDDMFYLSFQNVVPTGARTGLFLDVSGSMTCGTVGGVAGLTPRVASVAMAMMTLRTETNTVVAGFTSGQGYGHYGAKAKTFTSPRSSDGITELPVTAKQRLDDAMETVDELDFGGTDCSLPMVWALKHKIPLDVFVVYTDNETYAGKSHPVQALAKYRKEMGINAKLIVVGMVSNGFSIADPDDAGMLDVVGFDTSAPAIMADFVRGEL